MWTLWVGLKFVKTNRIGKGVTALVNTLPDQPQKQE